MESITILGVKVHRVTMSQALDEIARYAESNSGHIVVTADASGVVLAQKDEEFRKIINEADLVTPDSAGILLAARWMGSPLPERVSGVDLVREVCAVAARRGWPVFFLGAAPGIAELAAERLKACSPGLEVAGTHHGYFQDDGPVVRQISESGARVLFVALGIPKQEKWIHEHLRDLGARVAIGVGGSFDVLSGRIRRAPVWMQRHGLEWLFRLIMSPRKIGKVATLPCFLLMAIMEARRRRRLINCII